MSSFFSVRIKRLGGSVIEPDAGVPDRQDDAIRQAQPAELRASILLAAAVRMEYHLAGPGRRLRSAIFMASSTSPSRMWPTTDQPIIFRECPSITVALYARPLTVRR